MSKSHFGVLKSMKYPISGPVIHFGHKKKFRIKIKIANENENSKRKDRRQIKKIQYQNNKILWFFDKTKLEMILFCMFVMCFFIPQIVSAEIINFKLEN
jgi:hypothetical protein